MINKVLIVLTTPTLAYIAFAANTLDFATALIGFTILGLIQARSVTKVLYAEK